MGRFWRWVFGEDWGIRSLDGRSAPDSPENRRALGRFAIALGGSFMGIGAVLLGSILISGQRPEGLHVGQAVGSNALALVGIYGMWHVYLRAPIWCLHLLPLGTTAILVGVGRTLGPTMEPAVILGVVIIVVVVSVTCTLRASIVHHVQMAIGFGVVVLDQGLPLPFARWLGALIGAAVVGAVVEWLVRSSRDATVEAVRSGEAADAARTELAQLNHTLEGRVQQQVGDLERLGRLQRFLPAALVDAVLTDDGQALLEPHRQEIAVLFCDLRGFTAFASRAAPEEVHELLEAYFAALGEQAGVHEATVGAFTGDGLMAFFNDPLPVDDPACRALDLALAFRDPVEDLLEQWRRLGHRLGFGVGIALGYANIGMIGFEGRRDYTALGPVVNLAARLCAEAESGTILLDARAAFAVDGHTELGDAVELHLKGIDRVVQAYPVGSPSAAGSP